MAVDSHPSCAVFGKRYKRLGSLFLPCTCRDEYQASRHGVRALSEGSSPQRPVYRVAFDRFLRQWGTPTLAERAAHDFFFNLRAFAPALSRLRLFAIFAGCLPSQGFGSPFEVRVSSTLWRLA